MNERRPYRTFVSYIDKSRGYYAAQGYDQPYTWAYHDEAPFSPLGKPLSECRVGLVTTASNIDLGSEVKGVMAGRKVYAAPTDPRPERLFTGHLFWDKEATHTDDLETFLPIGHLSDLAASKRIKAVSPRFYGAPTDYSQGRTRLKDAPQILDWIREDTVDAVLLSAL